MTTWNFANAIDLTSDRIPHDDAERQRVTAMEICSRLETQPGLILADDVGMGKTFVALAVAASVVMANPESQVVVMVPSAVGEKWPKDWSVFRDNCLPKDHGIRATESTIRRGQDFLRLLDDEPDSRQHIIFLSHWALTSSLNDPFIQLALIKHVFKRSRTLSGQARIFHRFAGQLLRRKDFTPNIVRMLLDSPPAKWKEIWNSHDPRTPLTDDPIPQSVVAALPQIDLTELKDKLADLPLRSSSNLDSRLRRLRVQLGESLQSVWDSSLKLLDAELPLLILDEAHHLKNPNTLRGLLQNEDGVDGERLQGALGGVFERMLLMTATPFQLGHHELVRVLRLFKGVRMDETSLARFETLMGELSKSLDAAQGASLVLENHWPRLSAEEAGLFESSNPDLRDSSEAAQAVARLARDAVEKLNVASEALRPWVIRHTKRRRRTHLVGQRTHPDLERSPESGLQIENQSVLPFLLAARAQSLVALSGIESGKKTRALFADGLASSFEAYLTTRGAVDEEGADGDAQAQQESAEVVDWYLQQITKAIPSSNTEVLSLHPKVTATVQRCLQNWANGEKTIVFCFYRATGRAVQRHIARALNDWIVEHAGREFGIKADEPDDVIERLSERGRTIFDSDSPGTRALKGEVVLLGKGASLSPTDASLLADVVHRFVQLPSLIVRYVDVNSASSAKAVGNALAKADGSGVALHVRITEFARRIGMMTSEEKLGLWDSLDSIDVNKRTESIVAIANGETKADRRRRIVDVFNSPFPPDVLVTSSVMAEGVDLHRDCRHVIHHDLDWNPSTLEQRTGRVDRLGSKALLSGRPIMICEPFVAGTQDEKQFRVVKDREKWFGVLMGGRIPQDETSIDQIAMRSELPEALAQQLTLNLNVWHPTDVP